MDTPSGMPPAPAQRAALIRRRSTTWYAARAIVNIQTMLSVPGIAGVEGRFGDPADQQGHQHDIAEQVGAESETSGSG